jgi:D-3-phosphoglycerate dehydrogenase
MDTGDVFIGTDTGTTAIKAALYDQDLKEIGALPDVFWQEPLPSNHPLLRMPNVLITPHIDDASYGVASRCSGMIVEEIGGYVRKEPFKNVRKYQGV